MIAELIRMKIKLSTVVEGGSGTHADFFGNI